MAEPEPLQRIDRTFVLYRGRKFSCFSGCDYFRLTSHPAILQAIAGGLKQFGLSVSASRATTGNHQIYSSLERELARFFGADATLLLPGGYFSGIAVAQALAGNFSHALIDEQAHAALRDAASFLDCPILKFKHRDRADFARTLRRIGKHTRVVVLTDGLFPHDGSTAPLKDYLKRLPHDGAIIVDDAHGAGVLGRTGRGTPELEGIDRRRVIQCITLSKAFGAYGGAVLGSRKLRESILERSRIFTGSTPFPLPLANAALAAVKLLKGDSAFRERLNQNVRYVKTALIRAEFPLADTPGPIIPLYPASQREANVLKRRLLRARIYPPFLNYPGGPTGGYFRFALSSEHSREQLDNLIDVLTTTK